MRTGGRGTSPAERGRRSVVGRLAVAASIALTSITALSGADPAGAVLGEQVSTTDHPWAVRVLRANGRPLCSGTLIARQWVLTNAHCLVDRGSSKGVDSSVKSADEVSVVIGRSDWSTDDGFERSAERIVIHHEYFLHRHAWRDIGLIKLSSPVSSSFVLPLGESDALSAGDQIVIYGYGAHDDIIATGDLDAIDADTFLRAAPLTLASAPTAEIFYRSEGSITPQPGDSGAPLVTGGRLIGVHHGAFPSGRYEGYGVAISPNRGWIDFMMEVGTSSTNRRFRIENGYRRECLDLQTGFGNTRRLSSPTRCDSGDSSQEYQVTVENNGMLVVSNRLVSTCLGMEGGTSAGADSRVWTWDCNGKDAQNWIPVSVRRSDAGYSALVVNRARPDLRWSVRHVGGANRLVVRPVSRWATSSEAFRFVPAS